MNKKPCAQCSKLDRITYAKTYKTKIYYFCRSCMDEWFKICDKITGEAFEKYVSNTANPKASK